MTAAKEPPPGWGQDKLTKFIDDARTNQWATFWNKKGPVRQLVATDELFAKVSENWLNPDNEIAAFLLLRCHAAFRTAAGLAMAGQAAEVQVQCRAMLEYAAYAVHRASGQAADSPRRCRDFRRRRYRDFAYINIAIPGTRLAANFATPAWRSLYIFRAPAEASSIAHDLRACFACLRACMLGSIGWPLRLSQPQ